MTYHAEKRICYSEVIMIKKLRKKLKKEGRTLKWFVNKYLNTYHYQTIMQQINGFTTLQDYTIIAIEKYLEEK